MTDATSFTPPSPGLRANLFQNKSFEPYSDCPIGPEHVKLITLYRCYGETFSAATCHNDSIKIA